MTNTRTGAARVAHALTTAFTVVFATLGIILLAVALLARTDDRGITRVAGHPVMTVLSDSMTPTFRAGDLVVEDPVAADAQQLAVGDVITFRVGEGNELVTHRIIQVKSAPAGGVTYRTQGDANNTPDVTPVEATQVVGIYAWRIPYAGYAFEAVRSRIGMFLLIFVPLAALLLPLFARWWRSAGGTSDDSAAQEVESSDLVPSGRKGDGG